MRPALPLAYLLQQPLSAPYILRASCLCGSIRIRSWLVLCRESWQNICSLSPTLALVVERSLACVVSRVDWFGQGSVHRNTRGIVCVDAFDCFPSFVTGGQGWDIATSSPRMIFSFEVTRKTKSLRLGSLISFGWLLPSLATVEIDPID